VAGEAVDKKQLTQVGRALARLGIEHIPAYSPTEPDMRARIRLVWGFLCQGVFTPFLSSLSFHSFVRVRRETGKKWVVRVHHGEGVAIHIDPESCADAREGIGEALTRERIGQAIEP
jgi:hypothetical protein